ncbi:energy transducer TonB [Dyadobacter sp. OTU695]|uniref:energy transducer TonB n=1 Tax=Dyadobacter sp. OTU695 TaxID=3043860 RepID=UPI00406CB353
MYRFIESNLKIPKQAKKAGVSGRVFVSFYVQATGGVINVTVLKGLGYGCDREAVRLVNSMPRWKAGKESGMPVRTRYNLPISFGIK